MYFNFVNYYKRNIDFNKKDDNKSTTLDIDENVKVIFENKLGEENWLDGEGSADNKFGNEFSTSYFPPKKEDSNSQN